ncbi:MAG: hypothetical protein O7E52_09065 [Candidatus Poribacteria bacterium]|nr:hypothetical protein [Candidatus Poribacteria bacterium]
MPRDKNVEQSHCQPDTGFEVCPAPVHHFLESTYPCQHRENRLNHHAVVPLPSLANPQMLRPPIDFVEAFICKHDHLGLDAVDDMLEGAPIVDIGRVAIPINNLTQMVEQQTQLASDNPALIGNSLSANLFFASPYPQEGISFPSGVDELNTIGVNHSNQRRSCHEQVNEVLMRIEQTKQPRSRWQVGEHVIVVAHKPSIERAVPFAFEGKQQAYGDNLRWVEARLAVLQILISFIELIIDIAEQMCDKILGGHGVSSFCVESSMVIPFDEQTEL